jgi:hypothetical protein
MPLPAPAVSRGDQPQIQGQLHTDFVFEADVRWDRPPSGNQGSAWQLQFGLSVGAQDARVEFKSDRLISLSYFDFSKNEWNTPASSTAIPWMRPANEFNTFRVEVEQGRARVFVNSKYVLEAKVPQNRPGDVHIVLVDQEVNQDLRFRRIRMSRLNPPGP